MKAATILLTLATIATVALCDQRDFEKFNKACLTEANVTEPELKQFFSNGMRAADAKDNIKCHMKCVLEKQGVWANGAYNTNAAIKALKEVPQLKDHYAEIEEAVNTCRNEKGSNDCDTAFKITMCVKEHKAQVTA